jgi:hypothetical protein
MGGGTWWKFYRGVAMTLQNNIFINHTSATFLEVGNGFAGYNLNQQLDVRNNWWGSTGYLNSQKIL